MYLHDLSSSVYGGILQKNSFFYRVAGRDAPPALLLKIAAVLTHQVNTGKGEAVERDWFLLTASMFAYSSAV